VEGKVGERKEGKGGKGEGRKGRGEGKGCAMVVGGWTILITHA